MRGKSQINIMKACYVYEVTLSHECLSAVCESLGLHILFGAQEVPK